MLCAEARTFLNRLMDGKPNGLETIMVTKDLMYCDADGLYAGTLGTGMLVKGMPATKIMGRTPYWTVIRDGILVFVYGNEAIKC